VLSYIQSNLVVISGQVEKVKKSRPGVTEVAVLQDLKLNAGLQNGDSLRVKSMSFTNYVYFRTGQTVPKVGDNVSISSFNRWHRFTGRSFNWVRSWILQEEKAAQASEAPGPALSD